jgi:hypothetical protein
LPRTSRRRNPEPDPTPIYEWTETKTGRQYTTVTVRQDDGTFLCVLNDFPFIRENGRTAKEATTAMLKRIANPEYSPEEQAEDLKVAMERERRGKFLTREQFLRKMGRLDLLERKRGRR